MNEFNRERVYQVNLTSVEENVSIRVEDIIVTHVIVAIAKHQKCQELIRKNYELDRQTFESKTNIYPYSHVFDSFPAVEAHDMHKLARMYQAKNSKEKDNFLIGYIKQGYNRVIQYAERHPVLEIEHFDNFHRGRESSHVSEAETHQMIALLVFISWKYNKKIASKTPKGDALILSNLAINLLTKDRTLRKQIKLDEDGKRRAMNAYQSYFDNKLKREQAVDHMVNLMEIKALKNLPRAEQQKYFSGGNPNLVYKQDIYRYFKNFTPLMNLNGFNDFNYLDKVYLSNEHYYDIFSVFQYLVKAERIKQNEFPMFMSVSMVIHTLTHHYHVLKKAYFEQEKELDNNRALAVEVKEDSQQLERDKSNFEKEKRSLEERITFLENELKESHKREEKLRKEQEKETAVKQEIAEENEVLKKVLFKEDELLDISESTPEEDIIKKLTNLKVVVIGGHTNYHTKLKEKLPKIRCIRPDEKTVDFSFLTGMDAVVFVTSYNNHTQFYRTKSALKNTKVPLIMIGEQPSPMDLFAQIVQDMPLEITG
ncbi:hypothetical protein CN918_30120 [Priestia megaterium]|nr:hypothetical protein CN918_30120 [Priestia megaterium]